MRWRGGRHDASARQQPASRRGWRGRAGPACRLPAPRRRPRTSCPPRPVCAASRSRSTRTASATYLATASWRPSIRGGDRLRCPASPRSARRVWPVARTSPSSSRRPRSTSRKQALADAGGPRGARRLHARPASPTTRARSSSSSKLGRRAWRRPLTDEEVSRYAGGGQERADRRSTTSSAASSTALAGLLQSPHFLYRDELGAPDPEQRERASCSTTTSWRRACRIFLWNTTPDDQLLDAADAQQLTTAAGLATQVAAPAGFAARRRPACRPSSPSSTACSELDKLPQLTRPVPAHDGRTLGAVDARRDAALPRPTSPSCASGDYPRRSSTRATTFVNTELAKLYGLPASAGTTSRR